MGKWAHLPIKTASVFVWSVILLPRQVAVKFIAQFNNRR
jgi:hypothetical protein